MRRWYVVAIGLAPPALCIVVGAVLGLGSYTFWYAEGGSYFRDDPRACVNCHIMRDVYDGWQNSSHHATATCNDCHTPHELVGKYLTKAENGFWHSKAFTLQDYKDPLQIRPRNSRVLQQSCIGCHRDLVASLQGHLESADDETIQCVRCHASVGHGAPR